MNIVIDANILFQHTNAMRRLNRTLNNCMEYINEKMSENRISSKDTGFLIKYIKTKLNNIVQLYFESYGKLNKYEEIEKLVSEKAALGNNIMFTIYDEKFQNFLGIKYTDDAYGQMVLDLNNIQVFIDLLFADVQNIENQILADIENEKKLPDDNIIAFHHVKPGPFQKSENYKAQIEKLFTSFQNLNNILNINIDAIENYLVESNVLKTYSEVLDEINDNDDDDEEKDKYIFMVYSKK
jgi:hypothetical protein